MGSIVLRGLSDYYAGNQTGYYGQGEMPPVGSFRAEYQGEDAEGRKGAEYSGKIGPEAHGFEQLAHTGAFFGAYGKYAGD